MAPTWPRLGPTSQMNLFSKEFVLKMSAEKKWMKTSARCSSGHPKGGNLSIGGRHLSLPGRIFGNHSCLISFCSRKRSQSVPLSVAAEKFWMSRAWRLLGFARSTDDAHTARVYFQICFFFFSKRQNVLPLSYPAPMRPPGGATSIF